ncbi:unnamed protein product [Coccothraustes coccothraustes]
MAGGNRNTTGGRWRGPATTRRAAPRRGVELGAPPGRDGARRDAAAGPGRERAGTVPQPRRSRGAGATRAGSGAGAGRETRRRPVRPDGPGYTLLVLCVTGYGSCLVPAEEPRTAQPPANAAGERQRAGTLGLAVLRMLRAVTLQGLDCSSGTSESWTS